LLPAYLSVVAGLINLFLGLIGIKYGTRKGEPHRYEREEGTELDFELSPDKYKVKTIWHYAGWINLTLSVILLIPVFLEWLSIV